MKHKPFRTYDEQLSILEKKGLVISEKEFARNALVELNYYRLSGYTLTLRKDDKFYPGTTFEQAMQIYNFDKELKLLVLKYLEDIEISLRTHVAYELGREDIDEDSPLGYLQSDNYASPEHFLRFMSDLKNAHSDSKNEAFVKHHDTSYSGVLPAWAMVETLSFGSVSRLFAGLSIPLQKQICAEYYGGLRYPTIANWLEGLVVLRNLCAHHSRLFNRGIIMSPDFSSDDKNYFVQKGYERNQIGSRLFFRLVIIERLSPNPDIHTEITTDIKTLQEKYPFVDLSHYGFKRNWEEILSFAGKKPVKKR